MGALAGAAAAVSAESAADGFARLLAEHGAALRRVAATYEYDPSRREDLLQEIALAVWRALPRFRGECGERAFVLRVAHNRGLTHGWRARRHTLPLETISEPHDARPDPERLAVAAQEVDRLFAALRSLPPLQRQVLALALEGLPAREAAQVLGTSENNVAVRLSRARKALRTALAARERSPG
jgi:RNA polymerase sigma-70 factor (ECF subfamily)